MASRIIRNKLKRGIKDFEFQGSNSQFEDLIGPEEILDRITLEEKTQGRDIPLARLIELHRERRVRLARNYERMKKKDEVKRGKTVILQASPTVINPSNTLLNMTSIIDTAGLDGLKADDSGEEKILGDGAPKTDQSKNKKIAPGITGKFGHFLEEGGL